MIARLIRRLRIRRLNRLIARSRADMLQLGATHFLFDITQADLIAREATHQAKLTSRRDRLERAP